MGIKKIGNSFDNQSTEYIVIGRLGDIIASFRADSKSGMIYHISFSTTSYSEIIEVMKLCEHFTC